MPVPKGTVREMRGKESFNTTFRHNLETLFDSGTGGEKLEEQSAKHTILLAGKLLAAVAAGVFLYFYGHLILGIIPKEFLESQSVQEIWPHLFNIAALIIATEIFLVLTRFAISKYLENRGKKKEIRVILTLYTYLVWAFMGVLLLTTVFKDIGALLTSIGLIGFGITFALQKPILNFVGWLTIVITKPFNISDKIEVNNVRGDVLSIHVMYTKIQGTMQNAQTKSEQVISVPNELMLTNPVINLSRLGGLYTDDITVSLTYESNWKKAAEILESIAQNAMKKFIKNNLPATFAERRSWQEAIDLMQEATKRLRRGFVKQSVQEKIEILKTAESSSAISIPKPNILVSLSQSSIDLNVMYKTDLYSVRDTKNEIVRSFMEAIEKRSDIEIAYPHMQIVYSERPKKHSRNQEKLFKPPAADRQEPAAK